MLLASSRQLNLRLTSYPHHGSRHGRLGMSVIPDSPPFPPSEAQKTSYVGQVVQMAQEYHESDFDWHAHAESAYQIVMRQEKMAAAPPPPSSSQACMIRERSFNVVGDHGTSASSGPSSIRDNEAGISAPQPPDDSGVGSSGNRTAENHWEVFYQQHAEAKFYKLRRYILKVTIIQSFGTNNISLIVFLLQA